MIQFSSGSFKKFLFPWSFLSKFLVLFLGLLKEDFRGKIQKILDVIFFKDSFFISNGSDCAPINSPWKQVKPRNTNQWIQLDEIPVESKHKAAQNTAPLA
jgi:hypothetical protein